MSIIGSLLSALRWKGQGLLNGPSVVQSPIDHISANAQTVRPMRDGHASAFKLKEAIRSRVHALICHRGPAAVSGLVMPFIVDPFNRVVGRTWSHIFQKQTEIITPTRAHRNAPGAIILKVFRLRIETSSFGVIPAPILFASGCAVFQKSLRDILRFCATATCTIAASHRRNIYWTLCAAFAATNPIDRACLSIGKPYRGPASETLTREIR
jgi:hypothetical protein